MKKIFAVLLIAICAMIFSGCASNENEAPTLKLSPEGIENTIQETILYETVLTEQYI